jgi:hypothetical protein
LVGWVVVVWLAAACNVVEAYWTDKKDILQTLSFGFSAAPHPLTQHSPLPLPMKE